MREPLEDSAGPVARAPDNERLDVPQQVVAEVWGPLAATALRQVGLYIPADSRIEGSMLGVGVHATMLSAQGDGWVGGEGGEERKEEEVDDRPLCLGSDREHNPGR